MGAFKFIYMKKLIVIIAIFLVAGVEAQVTKASLQASGLTCAMCSKAVYKALSGVSFVEKVTANIQQSTYAISFKPGAKVDFDALSKAVTDAGFSVSMLKITTHFNDTKVQNDTHITLNGQTFHFLNVSPQILNGDKTITLVDKNFVTAKEYKKYSRFTTLKCYETGVMENCCHSTDAKATSGARVFHVTVS